MTNISFSEAKTYYKRIVRMGFSQKEASLAVASVTGHICSPDAIAVEESANSLAAFFDGVVINPDDPFDDKLRVCHQNHDADIQF
jgi:hypothetical protein